MSLLFKRVVDLVLAFFCMVAVLPLFFIIAILIKLDSNGPIFFIQERVGKNGGLFKIFKFRSMVENAVEIKGDFLVEKDDIRITKVGKWLRKTSFDELPQLINIFKGDMSFVGPRPTLKYQVEQYDEFQRRRLEVKPGVTGWAQINGRNEIPWTERIKLDVWYVDNCSFWLDLKILVRTFFVWLRKEGIYGDKDKFVIRKVD